uniref:Uncharacterized protein n=1 Tax=Anguilla anguilla TaxID=7936 RepID=A0A0E9PNI7_ANGAN
MLSSLNHISSNKGTVRCVIPCK